jgi:Protein kinase domain
MTPERWQAVKQLFYSALERDPEQRKAYLTERCGDDPELKKELESLLAQHERSTGFLSRPALAETLAAAADHQLQELAGKRLQHYEVERLIGKGGMGAVYAARDVRLGRRVAIKLLPPHLAPDPERVQRFRREAQAGSLINHPNIVTVHEIGQLASSTSSSPSWSTATPSTPGSPAARSTATRSWPLPASSPTRSPKHTIAASSIATSSRPISCSPRAASSRCSISGWPR